MAEAFQPRFVDLVRSYTTTVGTGNFVLGNAVTGFRSFGSAIQPGERFYYSAIGIEKPVEHEVGRGTMEPDGTISREPIGGAPTSFTGGNKTVALIAAAEWFDQVQAGAGGASAAASRAELAGLARSSAPAILHEPGREGLFVFDDSDRSADVAADPRQALFVAPVDDASGALGAWVRTHGGAIDARWFGTAGDSLTDDQGAIQAALALAGSVGPK